MAPAARLRLLRPRLGPPLDLERGVVEIVHGSGGRATAHLVEEIFVTAFTGQGRANPALEAMNDHAAISIPAGRLVVSTDAHVISPLFFPGGDIGSLSVYGTVNDVAMAGARPLHLAAAFIIEEGFPLKDLKRIATSMGAAAAACDVTIVTGDTKVVARGEADGVFITTTGLGVAPGNVRVSAERAAPGDRIILSGPLGEHGAAILAAREGLDFATNLQSDCAPLHRLVEALVDLGDAIHVLRDLTRGGLGSAANEIARQAEIGMRLQERAIGVKPAVRGLCEFLGLDPLYLANEGRFMAIIAPEATDAALDRLRALADGREAALIGEVIADEKRFIRMETSLGGGRIVDWLSGDPLPRIC
jgi:hydrogenase expression/formation protein HypE